MSNTPKCNPSTDELDSINKILELYLDEIDLWQREVDNIRIMHHEVWKGSRLSAVIKQHRAGSRVEKQTRILPIGGNTDIDYMFEVVGIQVLCNGNQNSMYFKPCPLQSADTKTKCDMSNSFGTIYVSEAYKSYLEGHEMYGKIFVDAMSFDQTENAYLINPGKFKENVVQNCGLDYTRNEALPSTSSPSISGQGAMNEYDGVPSLKLAGWPKEALLWISRQSQNDTVFQNEWKSKVVKDVPLFLVPTGNPMSEEQGMQFRLSFSMVEIACFQQMTSLTRKMYGIVKYVFKALFHNNNLLSSYHLKTLMLWKIEQTPLREWASKKTTDFILEMIQVIDQSINEAHIPHFFVQNCNIFPKHKVTNENILECAKIFQNMPYQLTAILENLLKKDLGVRPSNERWHNSAMDKLKSIRQTGLKVYIDGYLTRLLSVITFSLSENFQQTCQQGEASLEEMRKIFAKYDDDQHICRIINMVNSCIFRLEPSSRHIHSRITPNDSSYKKDEMSLLVHEAFEAYTKRNFSIAMEYINKADSLPRSMGETSEGIGISITKFHKCLVYDKPILQVIQILESEHNGKCPRFYIAPCLLLQHMKIQLQLNSLRQHNTTALQQELNKLHSIVLGLSPKEPYPGRLSYRFSGVYLLRGYERLIRDQNLSVSVTIPTEIFSHKRLATNFDLK